MVNSFYFLSISDDFCADLSESLLKKIRENEKMKSLVWRFAVHLRIVERINFEKFARYFVDDDFQG